MSNDYFNPPNSVWPNGLKRFGAGYVTFFPLGTNKVDISTITWPEGDKLVSPFVYQNDKLVGFVDTKAITVSGSATTTMNYSHIEADFSSISKGRLTIDAPNAIVKKFSWAPIMSDDEAPGFVIIDFTTADTETINTVRTAKSVVDNKLYDNYGVLIGTLNTSNIEIGGIFNERAIIADGIFSNMNDNGSSRGITLSEFNSDLSSLRDGSVMFAGCPLTSFDSDLSNLTSGNLMFWGCKLDGPSIRNIIDKINTYSGKITIGLGYDNTQEDASLFIQESGYADMASFNAAVNAKRWNFEIQFNGKPTTTYGLRRTSGNTLPVFAKIEKTEKYADYTSMDGSTKYRLNWFHMTTGSTNGYTQFNSLEEAVAHFNIKPIEIN